MGYSLTTGVEQFFQWCKSNEATATVCYTPSCCELEIRVEIFGEYEFYCKRAGSFESALERIREEYAAERLQRDNKTRYEQQEVTISTLKGCLEHYKQECAALKEALAKKNS